MQTGQRAIPYYGKDIHIWLGDLFHAKKTCRSLVYGIYNPGNPGCVFLCWKGPKHWPRAGLVNRVIPRVKLYSEAPAWHSWYSSFFGSKTYWCLAGNGWEWGLLGWLLIVILDHSLIPCVKRTSKKSLPRSKKVQGMVNVPWLKYHHLSGCS